MPEKISYELARAIGQLLCTWDDNKEAAIKDIVEVRRRNDVEFNKEMELLQHSPFITIVKAIVNGYEVQESPEEEIARFYQRYIISSINFEKDFAHGMKYVIDKLNIKIEGVNS